MKVFVNIIGVLLICCTGIACCCPMHWAAFKSHCYYFSKNTTSWFEAEQFCRSQHSNLATIDDTDEISVTGFVLNAESLYYDTGFWIGGNDLAQEGQWRWFVNGELIPLDSPFWFNNQPQGGDVENCLALKPCRDTACYHDYECGRKDLHFMCEKQNLTGEATVIG